MTIKNISKLPGRLLPELAQEMVDMINNAFSNGVVAHLDSVNTQITAANATDLPTLKTLILALTNAQVAHGIDVAQHSAADAALDIPAGFVSHPAEPADLAECQAVNNVLKIDLNAHMLNATPHRGVGGQGGFAPVAVSTTDGSNQATNETLANALKAAYNLHFASGVKTIALIAP